MVESFPTDDVIIVREGAIVFDGATNAVDAAAMATRTKVLRKIIVRIWFNRNKGID
jgi:hypothetical protein